MFDIEKNIKLTKTQKVAGESKYPFSKMEIGDSFFVSENAEKPTANTVRQMAHNFGKKSGAKFSARVVVEEGKGRGLRIWRVATNG